MIPDPEAILTTYLESHVTPLGATIVDLTPDDLGAPWVRLTLLDAPSDGIPDHLVAAYVQLDCYAGQDAGEDAHEDASLIARTVRAALVTIHEADHDGAAVSGCRIDGMPRMPDPAFEPPLERYVLTATVWMHGVPG